MNILSSTWGVTIFKIERKHAFIATIGAALFAVSTAAPAAATAETEEAAVSCTTAQYDAGLCMAGFWPEEAADPIPLLVAQAVQAGDTAQAERFVAERGNRIDDAAQDALEDFLSTSPDSSEAADFAARWAGTDGQIVTAYQHNTAVNLAFGICSWSSVGVPAGCTLQGSIAFELNYGFYFYPEVVLDGFIGISGAIGIVDFQCRTRLDEDPFLDTTARTWNTCAQVESPYPAPANQTIFPETWTQAGIAGRTYHMDYTLTGMRPDWPSPKTAVFTTHPYKITGIGSASFNY